MSNSSIVGCSERAWRMKCRKNAVGARLAAEKRSCCRRERGWIPALVQLRGRGQLKKDRRDRARFLELSGY